MSAGDQIVAWASDWLGTRGYTEGSSHRFGEGVTRADCSAFVNAAVHAATGQYIGGKDSWTGSQMDWLKANHLWVGGSNAWKLAQPGDVVYYAGHVALYEGGGKVISNGGDPIVEHRADYRPVLGIGRTSTLGGQPQLQRTSNTTASSSGSGAFLPEGWTQTAGLLVFGAMLLIGGLFALVGATREWADPSYGFGKGALEGFAPEVAPR